jgi:hypothetical protein
LGYWELLAIGYQELVSWFCLPDADGCPKYF